MKTLKRITVLMAIMSLFAYQAFSQNVSTSKSQGDPQKTQTASAATPGKFVDANHDGICDNYQTRLKNGHGANFVDKNGDGICDNRQNGGQGKGNCTGCGMGRQYRNGHGNGNCCGNGCGNKHRQGRGN
jgi:hypothetical protein